MMVALRILNESARKRHYRRDWLTLLAEKICTRERAAKDVEISVLFCDDPSMTKLNREYRGINESTDVLSFGQKQLEGITPVPLGDIVISLETVERNCVGDRALMRKEVDLLFCHGLLHLLGYDHQTEAQREAMAKKQSEYLVIPREDAWTFGPKTPQAASRGGDRSVERR